MKLSINGALVGAAVCSAGRVLVLLINLGFDFPLLLTVPTLFIGALVGMIAGAFRQPWVGALVGGILSALAFQVLMLPWMLLVDLFGPLFGNDHAAEDFFKGTLIYVLEMGIAGAIAGALGGWVSLTESKRNTEEESPPQGPVNESPWVEE